MSLTTYSLGDPSNLDILPVGLGIVDTRVNFNNNNDNFCPRQQGQDYPARSS